MLDEKATLVVSRLLKVVVIRPGAPRTPIIIERATGALPRHISTTQRESRPLRARAPGGRNAGDPEQTGHSPATYFVTFSSSIVALGEKRSTSLGHVDK
jgi:hypothetical protein